MSLNTETNSLCWSNNIPSLGRRESGEVFSFFWRGGECHERGQGPELGMYRDQVRLTYSIIIGMYTAQVRLTYLSHYSIHSWDKANISFLISSGKMRATVLLLFSCGILCGVKLIFSCFSLHWIIHYKFVTFRRRFLLRVTSCTSFNEYTLKTFPFKNAILIWCTVKKIR